MSSTSKDWLANDRDALLSTRAWVSVAGANAAAWGIPQTAVSALESLTQTAETATNSA